MSLSEEPKLVGQHLISLKRTQLLGTPNYTHHAICVAPDTVIEASGLREGTLSSSSASSSSSSGADKGPITEATLSKFVGSEPLHEILVRVYRGQRFSEEEVVQRARSEYPYRDRAYDFLWHNCEHFATWCMNDKFESWQAKEIREGGGTIAFLKWAASPFIDTYSDRYFDDVRLTDFLAQDS